MARLLCEFDLYQGFKLDGDVDRCVWWERTVRTTPQWLLWHESSLSTFPSKPRPLLQSVFSYSSNVASDKGTRLTDDAMGSIVFSYYADRCIINAKMK